MSAPTALIIGAGVAGLATAALLGKEGYQVRVVEKLDTVGGRAGDLTVADHPGFRWDTGPSWYLMPDAFEHFFGLDTGTDDHAGDPDGDLLRWLQGHVSTFDN